jgi:ABC-type multidrug transport system fused ATPase/permease subunit
LNGCTVRTGKSTTLKLITRMIEPSSGDILLDGVDIQKATLQSLRKKVAVIPQDTCLFDESIRYNILYG